MKNSTFFKFSVLSTSRRTPTLNWLNNAPGNYELGVAKSYQLSVVSFPSQVSYSVISGALPSGLSLSSSGLISGTPSTANQSFSYTVSASNGFLNITFSQIGTVAAFSASGGTETTVDGIKTHVFTSSANFVISTGLKPLEIMLVAAGGGGGGRHGGGGGGGQIVYSSSWTPSFTGTYPIQIGSAGGVSDPNPAIERSRGSSGGSTQMTRQINVNLFDSITTAVGGGGGGSYSAGALSGGCGGGGAGMLNMTGATNTSLLAIPLPSGFTRYGTSGGNGNSSTEGGGGGGANAAGSNAGSNGGNGGNGKSFMGYTVSGGGGGGAQTTGGTGGTGGGGNGGSSGGAGSAATYYGGGGGGSRSNPTTNQAGVGYQGLVVIRYAV